MSPKHFQCLNVYRSWAVTNSPFIVLQLVSSPSPVYPDEKRFEQAEAQAALLNQVTEAALETNSSSCRYKQARRALLLRRASDVPMSGIFR